MVFFSVKRPETAFSHPIIRRIDLQIKNEPIIGLLSLKALASVLISSDYSPYR